MKKIVILLWAMMPGLLWSQNFSLSDKKNIAQKVDTLIYAYMQKSSLKEPGQSKYSEKVFREYKKLFTTDAKIFDEINPEFDKVTTGYPYVLVEDKSVFDYFDGLSEQFPNGIIINNKRININYQSFDKGVVTVAVERNLDAVNYKGFHYINEDTVKLTIAVLPDKSVKIKSVTKIGSNFRCANDDDIDGVINEKDRCPDARGKIALQGCPDSDNDGIADRDDDCPDLFGFEKNNGCPSESFAYTFVFSAFAGYQFNANFLKMPELSKTGYKGLDNDLSRQGKLSDPGLTGSLTLGANIGYYFGKKKNKKNIGVSLGIWAAKYSTTYEVTNSAVYTFKANDSEDDYWRRIVLKKGSKETLKFNIINIPLMLHYKAMFKPKLAFDVSAGPSVIIFKNFSEFNSNFDFEAVYAFDDNGTNVVNNSSAMGSSVNYWILTAQGINGMPGIDNHDGSSSSLLYTMLTAQDAHYDLASNKNYSGTKGKVNTITSIGLNANLDLFYHLTPKIAVKLAVNFTYASLKNSNDSYKIIDATSDSYNSIYNSSFKAKYTSFGFNGGVILGL